MKRVLLFLVFVLFVYNTYGQKVVFMPCWTEQSQWAGYYMALEHGFYAEEGLDVEIVHPAVNSTSSVFLSLVSGKVDIVSSHLVTVLQLRAKGYPFVNILQTSQHSSLYCVTRTRIDSIQQLKGMTVARWKMNYGDGFDLINQRYNLNLKWIPYINGVNLFVSGAVDAILCCSYNEYISLLTSLGTISENCVIKAADYGCDFPEDGLYVTSYYLTHNRETVEKFVRASIRGWQYTATHQQEVVDYFIQKMVEDKLSTNHYHQKKMLEIILELQKDKSSGKPEFTPMNIEDYYVLVDELKKLGKISTSIKYTDFIKDLRPEK